MSLQNTFPVYVEKRRPHIVGEDEPREEYVYFVHCMLGKDDLLSHTKLDKMPPKMREQGESRQTSYSGMMFASGSTLEKAFANLGRNLQMVADISVKGEALLFDAEQDTREGVEKRLEEWRSSE